VHPLAPDLTKLSDDELHAKRAELQNRMSFAYRMGQGDMVGQLQLLVMNYDMEIQTRNQRMLDNLQKTNKNFGNVINISK
jgi:hypothetical protein